MLLSCEAVRDFVFIKEQGCDRVACPVDIGRVRQENDLVVNLLTFVIVRCPLSRLRRRRVLVKVARGRSSGAGPWCKLADNDGGNAAISAQWRVVYDYVNVDAGTGMM